MSLRDRTVFGDINARNELEVIDNIYDRTIITTNSANILNIMSEFTTLNPEEEVIRKRGRKKTPKISLLPLRRSPRKATNNNITSKPEMSSVQTQTTTDQSHDYFLRTPSKKTSSTATATRTPRKLLMSPTKASTPSTPLRVSPRKRLQLNTNDSGIGLSPTFSGSESMSNSSANQKSVRTVKTQTKPTTKRRRRRYF